MTALPDDKVVRLLSFFIVFFTFIVLGVAIFRPEDGQTFSVFVGPLSAFVGSLLMRFSPEKTPPVPPPSLPAPLPKG